MFPSVNSSNRSNLQFGDTFGLIRAQNARHDAEMAALAVDTERDIGAMYKRLLDEAVAQRDAARQQGAVDYRDKLQWRLELAGVVAVNKAINNATLEIYKNPASIEVHRALLGDVDDETAVIFSNLARRKIYVAAVRERAKALQAAATDIQKSYISDVAESAEKLLLLSKLIAVPGGPAI